MHYVLQKLYCNSHKACPSYCVPAWKLYRIESQHLPVHPVTAALLRDIIKRTHLFDNLCSSTMVLCKLSLVESFSV